MNFRSTMAGFARLHRVFWVAPLFAASAFATQTTGVELHGRILDVEDEPLARSRVLLVDATGATHQTTNSDDLGRFVFRGLEPQNWTLEVRDPYLRHGALSVQLDGRPRTDVVLQQRRIEGLRGWIHIDGSPAVGALVGVDFPSGRRQSRLFSMEVAGFWRPMGLGAAYDLNAFTRRDGTFHLPDVGVFGDDGGLDLEIRQDGVVLRTRVAVYSDDPVHLDFRTDWLEFWVQDESGRQVAGFPLRLQGGRPFGADRALETDDRGHALVRLQAGRFAVEGEDDTRIVNRTDVETGSTPHTLIARRKQRLGLRVLDPDGRPARGPISIKVHGWQGQGQWQLLADTSGEIDEEGLVRFDSVPGAAQRRELSLYLRPGAGVAPPLALRPGAGLDEPVVVRLVAPGRLEIRGVAVGDVVLAEFAGAPGALGGNTALGRTDSAGANGVVLDELAPGTWKIQSFGSRSAGPVMVEVRSGVTTEFVFP